MVLVWEVIEALLNYKDAFLCVLDCANEFHRGKKGGQHCVCPFWC